ncbi:MAG: polysaccharide biosynthesis/export family protein [Bacteroidales bacterium]|nr:polysaccharide biosynthesis/export family protein [Bacteroidales bacterium]
MLAVLTLGSCRSARDYVYISDAQRDSAQEILTNYSALAMPGDELEIDIVSQSPESLYQFYERMNIGNLNDRQALSLRETYLVAPSGDIDLPLLGKMPVAGLPLDTIAAHIQQKLKQGEYVSDPIVSVGRRNFRVTVTGEVANPGMLHIQGNRLTILEALAQVGDITIYGIRDKIKVMREENGEQVIGEINVTTKEMFDSPYYYLKQNDIVYVEPNGKKKRTATYDPNIPSYLSIGLAVIRVVSSIYLNKTSAGLYQ